MTQDVRSIANFRDAGGLASRSGGTIQRGRLFRCGAPATVTPDDMAKLRALAFGLIADLRYVGEQAHQPSVWPEDWAGRITTYAGPADRDAPHMEFLRAGTMTMETSRQCYEQVYREVPFDPAYQAVFGRVMRGLAEGHGPMLVHCSAGKDRTGMIVALIHHALGASRDDITENFLLSNQAAGLVDQAEIFCARLKERFDHDVPLEVMQHALSVDESYLDVFFQELTDRAGSLDNYLESLGFDAKARESAMVHWLDFV